MSTDFTRSADRLLANRLLRTRTAPNGPVDQHALSAAQERMWFLHEMQPESAAYNVTTVARLTGNLDEEALQRAVRDVVKRHELLRSQFYTSENGTPRRRCLPDVDVPLEIYYEAHSADRRAAEPFDLRAGPLLRAVVVHLRDDDHMFALIAHHIVVDGWSLGVLHRDLRMCYSARNDCGLPPELEFAQVVAREQQWLTGPGGERDRAFWLTTLAGLPAVELPLARPRPAVARFVGRSVEIRVSEVVTQALEQFARDHRSSLYMVSLAAFCTLLHRYSGQEDIAVGTPVANRHEAEVADMVGPFVNTLVVRTDLAGTPTFTELLDRVRSRFLAALEHQRMPFEQLVRELNPDRALSHTPLVQVMFALQDAVSEPLALDGVEATPMHLDIATTRFDLECTIWRTEDGLRLRFTHNVDILEESVINQLSDQYGRLLASVVENPDRIVQELDLLSDAEIAAQQRLSVGPEPTCAPQCLHEWFECVAAANPTSTAVSAHGTKLTFAELEKQANQLAHKLVSLGVRPGQLAAIATNRTCGLVVATLGVLKAGAAFVPLNPLDPEARLGFQLADAGAVAVLVEDQERWKFTDLPTLEVSTAGDGSPAGSVGRISAPTDLAYVLYTSGTTGRPKGVAVEHRNIVNTLAACHDRFNYRRTDVGLVLAPHTFDVFYYELFSALLAGGQSCLVNQEELLDPNRVVPVLREATTIQAVPGLMEHLLQALAVHSVRQLPAMRLVMTGGDLVPSALFQRLREQFPNAKLAVTYGPTESAIFCTWHELGRSSGHPIGEPLPGTAVWVMDAEGRPLPLYAPGELWITGRGVARGYLNRDEETAERFVIRAGQRYYRSGDRGRWHQDGGLEFLGRTDNQVKVRGFRIELGEVEAALNNAPDVQRAVALVRGDTSDGRHIAAYVVANPPALDSIDVSDETVRNWQELFDETHAVDEPAKNRDFTGWNSSYDQKPLPVLDMDDWLDGTVRRLREKLAGKHRPRVLEIGCGTGLLLLEIAADCSQYVATDFSAVSLRRLSAAVRNRGWDHVELALAEARELAGIGTGFDAVVINSVTQYLPGAEELAEVLHIALELVADDGFVFVGDVRSLPLLPTFLCSVELATKQADDVLAAVGRRLSEEDELVLSPAYFTRFGASQIEPRNAWRSNELSRYRYDVTLWRALGQRLTPAEWQSWSAEDWDEAKLARTLAAHPTDLALTGVVHAHLFSHVAAYAEVRGTSAPGGCRVLPERLREIAVEHGYRALVSCSRSDAEGTFDVRFVPASAVNGRWVDSPWPSAGHQESVVANDPLRPARRRRFAEQAREFLADRLSKYMMPASVVAVDTLPVSPNGKIDRVALAREVLDQPSAVRRRPPETDCEVLVSQVWEKVVGCSPPDITVDFFEIGGTSLLAIQVVAVLRKRGCVLRPQQVFELRTVERIAQALETAPAPAVVAARQYQVPTRQATVDGDSRWRTARRVLLTGSTGMLGVHVLEQLLRLPGELPVTCLVRAGNDESAERRLREQFGWYFPYSPLLDAFDQRVEVIAGDLTTSRLGLSAQIYRALAERCDHVVHAAANVRHVAESSEVFATNVDGTQRVLDLAGAGSPTRVNHVSTIGVAGRWDGPGSATLREGDLDIGQRLTEPYSASKFEAERHVRGFLATGGTGTVLRVGTVEPNSTSGRFQRNIDAHFFSRYLRATLSIGIAANWPERGFSLIPVDIMSEIVIALAGTPKATGSTFHVQTPYHLTHYDLLRALHAIGYSIRLVPAEQFGDVVLGLGCDPAEFGRLLPLMDRPEGSPVLLDCARTEQLLSELKLHYPAPTTEWIAKFLRHGATVGYFPDPPGGWLNALVHEVLSKEE